MTRGATLDDRRAPMMRALGVLALALAFTTPASTQDTGTSISAPLDWGTAAAWLDADADGKADYCRLSPDTRLRCTLSVGNGFGGTIVSGSATNTLVRCTPATATATSAARSAPR